MAGNGLTSTLLGIRAGLEGFRPSVVGVVLAGYYLGFAVGSLAAPPTIVRVGHVRVFAGLASLASGTVLIHVLRPEPATWFVLRAVSGMCISALYVVCEQHTSELQSLMRISYAVFCLKKTKTQHQNTYDNLIRTQKTETYTRT